MNNQRYIHVLLLSGAVFILISFRTLFLLPDNLRTALSNSLQVIDTTATRRLTCINRAVRDTQNTVFFEYEGDFDTPFRKWNYKRTPIRRAASPSTSSRTQLSLKGILFKNKALAILDNGLGETRIRSVGEMAFEQKIIAISKNRVTLRDHIGTYEITVKEQ